jgi:tetratricopeptide (TPR) repeat protein
MRLAILLFYCACAFGQNTLPAPETNSRTPASSSANKPLPEGKPWIEVDSLHFRVLSNGSEGDARRVAREFEQMRAVLADQFPSFRLESGAPLLILAPRDEDTAKKLAPQFWKAKGAKPAGYFQHGWEKQFAMVRLDTIAPDTYQVVYHEYVHTVLHINFRWLPLWLDEGLAEFYGNSRFERSKILIGAPTTRYAYLQGRPLIPIDTLLTVNGRSPYYHDQDKVQIFYGEAWALVHFLTFGPGMLGTTKLTQFNNLLQQGTEQKKAFQQVFGDTADLQKKLDEYVHHPAFTTGVIKTPPKLDEKEFPVRALSMAETESQLGSYHLWSYHLPEARQYIEQAVKDDPKLGFAHENMGFLDFRDGKDEEAGREFSQAYELDNSLYLSLFYMTMLSGVTRSDKPADQASLHDALLKTLDLNRQFAPAYVELALLDIRQDKYSDALGVARRAEQLEPARAGYHLLSGQILLRLGRGTEASAFARYVAERWFGPDHDEAVALWNDIPEQQRGQGDPLLEEIPKDTQTTEGRVHSTTCPDDDSMIVVLNRGDQALTFHGKFPFMSGFSDTVWYGTDHFNICRHFEGLRAIVRYKPSADSRYAGELAELEFREELPTLPAPKADTVTSK